MTTLTWRDEAAAQRAAALLARAPQLGNAFIALRGDLGAGKTTFTRHLLRALGVTGPIKSPTFAVVEPYEAPGGLHIWHCDFYRFHSVAEWEDAGLRDIFAAKGLKIAEWPERVEAVLPIADLVLQLAVKVDNQRTVELAAPTATGAQLLRALRA